MSGDKCPVTLTLDPGVVPACLPTAGRRVRARATVYCGDCATES